ncbi:MAG: DUF4038 domain-containing protein [Paludisphaera borealis]|uniref:apiosidase-like domain-containing protein n=1 Tax=Paludisphaera borealis TaxID=1387353 RepID=UPI0028448A42|nr:DUF4038 domain-containing protein [Paludisphaera borealis]MDR3623369.1 DUF4038 domain-containing protein [Paludisphaera borealis]
MTHTLFRRTRCAGAALVVLSWIGISARAAEPLRVEAGKVAEVALTSAKERPDPFNTVTLDVDFTAPDGSTLRVPAFWSGGKAWRVRYSSRQQGTHRYRSICSDLDDAGLHGIEGVVEIAPYTGSNPLLIHGPIRVADDHRHFAHADGTPFFWLGDTWWMGLTKRLGWPDDFQTLAADRREKGFNVVQIVAGLYPDMPAFDPRGENEAGFPWEKDYSRIRPEYFDAADRRIAYLTDQGFVPCIVGAWGYHLPYLGEAKMKQHWRNIVARWGAQPVVWCAAGETTMPFYLSKTKEADADRQKREWTEVMAYIREIDPFHRLLTCHPSRTARTSVTDPKVLDFDMHQSGHGTPAQGQAVQAFEGWQTEPTMPVISGESRYEALEIRPTLTAADARQAFWAHTVASGLAGHTYGVNGVWQVNGRETPYGASPGGNNWGTTPWDVAMKLPGSGQIAAARRLIESIPGWNHFEPRPDLVAWTAAPPAKTPAPLCVANSEGARLVYLAAPRDVALRGLPAGASLQAFWFDPVEGKKAPAFDLKADAQGQAVASPPNAEHDWVLVVSGK